MTTTFGDARAALGLIFVRAHEAGRLDEVAACFEDHHPSRDELAEALGGFDRDVEVARRVWNRFWRDAFGLVAHGERTVDEVLG